jgi:hypothetical protein
MFFLQQSNTNTHNNNNNNNSNNNNKKNRLLSIPNEIFWCHSKVQVFPRLQCAYRSIPARNPAEEKKTQRESVRACVLQENRDYEEEVHRGSRSSPRLQVICKSSEDCFYCKSYVSMFVCLYVCVPLTKSCRAFVRGVCVCACVFFPPGLGAQNSLLSIETVRLVVVPRELGAVCVSLSLSNL